MAMIIQKCLILAVIAIISLTGHLAYGCSPIPGESVSEASYELRLMKSDVIAKGIPRHHHRDTRFPYDEVYIVDFEVRCFFKGGPLPEMIRIYEVGHIAGLCLSTEFPQNESLLVYLSRDENQRLVPAFVQDPGNEHFVDELMVLCDIEITYPEGFSELRNKEQCPEYFEYDECVAAPTTTVEPPTPPVPTPKRMGDSSGGVGNKKPAKDGQPTDKNTDKNKNPNKLDDSNPAYENVKTGSAGSSGSDGSKIGTNVGDGDGGSGSPMTFACSLFVVMVMASLSLVLA